MTFFNFVWSPVTVFVAAGKTFGCPLTSSCRKHCQMNKFKGGQCEGNLRLLMNPICTNIAPN
ncbi:hypothetical protein TYRP_022169 [Tyrophagus putrescentiae]|nr:hypothetical protein TYRP_022169 [Tyrophagus putrescentiae]